MSPGRLIVLEGLDGAGTTTQVERLASALRAEGHPVFTTREPSDGPVGMLLHLALAGRLVLPGGAGPLASETLALLYAADRTDHLRARVLPALEAGQVVLIGRPVLSSLGFQGVPPPLEWVASINAHARPADLTLWVSVSQKVVARGRISRQCAAALELLDAREHVVRVDGDAALEDVTAACLAHIHYLLADMPGRAP